MSDFNSFVIFAEMRTGSNLLEATLNAIKRVTCFGEAFNPYMLGWHDTDQIRGISKQQREEDPLSLLAAITGREDHLSGFRYFHDHDPRVFDAIMANRRCAKIVLTRNPLESYVSTELAWHTNQWKLNQTETPIPAAIEYDGAAFRKTLASIREFQGRVLHRLQTSGQAAYWLNYDDLRDSQIMTGLLHWLGRTDLEKVSPASDQVPQNPREMSSKVSNFDAMRRDLSEFDPFELSRIPTFEPKRGPAVPSFYTSEAGGGLVFMPVKGGPTDPILSWLKAIDAPIKGNHNQTSLRKWLRCHPDHRSFTVLRHPLRRAWSAFSHLIGAAPAELRQQMRETHRVPLPADEALFDMTPEQQHQLFMDFLGFLRRCLNGQTSLQMLPVWASQTEVLAGFAQFLSPDMIMREDTLERDLNWMASAAGLPAPATPLSEPMPEFLTDNTLQKAAQAAYQRDYIQFGFGEQV
ncbi:sulfotransferase family 2 domain-containing protein [Paracoccus albus]|uniref:sulfotransferase family 2 domain-containing protein n=1 Tax=Paracoccus albus TaxID=3017784 RepID=UPI0022F09DDF|nr:sulfotransferase family 2 domain-containing protein [Paracoccus albus]WBU60217.1 sulfotransferase family 2 domain-containing protein [Paracoccus albus]